MDRAFSAVRVHRAGRVAPDDRPCRIAVLRLRPPAVPSVGWRPDLARGLLTARVPLEDFMKLVAIALIALGVVGLVWGGISWTETDTVADLGPVEIKSENRESLPLPPIVGG